LDARELTSRCRFTGCPSLVTSYADTRLLAMSLLELASPRCMSIVNMSSIELSRRASEHIVLIASAVIVVCVSTLVSTRRPAASVTASTKSRNTFCGNRPCPAVALSHASPCSGRMNETSPPRFTGAGPSGAQMSSWNAQYACAASSASISALGAPVYMFRHG
jgi:uncharacterized protein (DUF58 family)